MSVDINDLDSTVRAIAEQHIQQCAAAGVPVTITYTLRTQAAEAVAVAQGRSTTLHSMHLAHPPEGKALAYDICPTCLLKEPNYAPSSSLWWTIGMIGVGLGLRWGGQWDRPSPPLIGKVPNYQWDPGHFEYRFPDGCSR